MIRIIGLSLILFIFFGNGLSNFKTKSTLYKVYKPGTTDTSYVFGTIHLLPKKKFFIPEVLENSLLSCNALVMELDMNVSIQQQINILKKAALPEGKVIADYMNPDSFNLLHSYFVDTLGLKEKKMQKYYRFEPFFIQSFVFKDYYRKIESYELNFNKLAKKNNIPAKSLETWEFQLGLIDSMGLDTQFELLNTKMIAEYEELMNYYLSNDFDKVELMLKEELDSEFEENFLKRRNETWIPLILDMLEKDKVFIAVGAAHIIGENGILVQLQKHGFYVEPVKI